MIESLEELKVETNDIDLDLPSIATIVDSASRQIGGWLFNLKDEEEGREEEEESLHWAQNPRFRINLFLDELCAFIRNPQNSLESVNSFVSSCQERDDINYKEILKDWRFPDDLAEAIFLERISEQKILALGVKLIRIKVGNLFSSFSNYKG